jgi:CO dehydrogenase maturation factor
MEAGLEHLKRGTLEHADTLLIIIEPYFKSLEAAGRVVELARNLGVPTIYAVANKVQSARDETAIRSFCATKTLPLMAVVPLDDDVSEAERQGRAPIDFAPGAAAVVAIRELARGVLAGTVTPREDRVAD